MKILFVCKWNRFRSKSAEAAFKSLNRNPENYAQSAGLFPGVPVSDDIIEAGKSFGLEIDTKQQATIYSLLMWADKIIIVADDVPAEIFKEFKENDKKEVEIWKFPDIIGNNVEARKEVIFEIIKKVEELVR